MLVGQGIERGVGEEGGLFLAGAWEGERPLRSL
jgi:hypothetical protein